MEVIEFFYSCRLHPLNELILLHINILKVYLHIWSINIKHCEYTSYMFMHVQL